MADCLQAVNNIKVMTNYRLTYFKLRGTGEIVRLVFAAAGVQYEDNRIEMSQWPQLKSSKLAANTNLDFNNVTCMRLLVRQKIQVKGIGWGHSWVFNRVNT